MWTVPREWAGETVFIFGGGPSLKGFDPARLRGRRAIAINRIVLPVDSERRIIGDPGFNAAELVWPGVPWADVVYFCDTSWWTKDGLAVRLFWQGKRIITTSRLVKDPDILRIKNTGPGGLERRPTGVKNGANSGHQCINLAFHFGARRIVLLGFDQNAPGGQTHVHGGYRGPAVTEQAYLDSQLHGFKMRHMPYFERMAGELRKESVAVLNASPDSAIECWPKITLDEACAL